MKKLFAAFVFAVGLGASFSAVAGNRSCEYWCAVDQEVCARNGGDDCYDRWLSCWVRCGNDIP
ncbi:hypothetical protein [Pseudoduganella violaceinigra]|uniref:hypothetical protein n=1 Tax=Pseudoduganella violaceinigra TaxID=246602 RepID=UPI000407F2B3|nr:hypothetical protein [Pseudoduganella violaceinigra]